MYQNRTRLVARLGGRANHSQTVPGVHRLEVWTIAGTRSQTEDISLTRLGRHARIAFPDGC